MTQKKTSKFTSACKKWFSYASTPVQRFFRFFALFWRFASQTLINCSVIYIRRYIYWYFKICVCLFALFKKINHEILEIHRNSLILNWFWIFLAANMANFVFLHFFSNLGQFSERGSGVLQNKKWLGFRHHKKEGASFLNNTP